MTKTTSTLIGLAFGLAIGAAAVFFCLAVPARKENVTMREMLRSQAKVVEGFEWNGRMSQKHPGTVADDMRRAADYSAPVFEKP